LVLCFFTLYSYKLEFYFNSHIYKSIRMESTFETWSIATKEHKMIVQFL
jgi:hypothetical protein